MRRTVYILLLAVSVVMSCTKTDIQYEATEEINLSVMNMNMTRSMMTGTEFLGESFNVWAWYKPLPAGTDISAWQQSETAQQTYLEEKTFVKKDGTTTNEWKGEHSYFWPKQGSLLFAGYYAPDKDVSYVFDGTNNTMTFSGIESSYVSNESGYTEDIMYFNMTPSSLSSGPVAVAFKHALSWITVTLQKRSNPEITASIKVHEVSFSNVFTKGDGTVEGSQDIVWDKDENSPEGIYYLTTDSDTDSSNGHDANIDMTTELKTLQEPLFIPQAMSGKLTVKYSVVSTDNSKFTETYEIDLNKLTYGGNSVNSWEPGKHYTYAITIGTEEILVTPTITDWEGIKVPVDIPIQEKDDASSN